MTINNFSEFKDLIFEEVESCLNEARNFNTSKKESIFYKMLRYCLSFSINYRIRIYQFMDGEIDIEGKSIEDYKNEILSTYRNELKSENIYSESKTLPDFPETKLKSPRKIRVEQLTSQIIDYESRKRLKIVDSMDSYFTLGDIQSDIINEIAKMASKDVLINQTKAFCYGFDAELYCAFEGIEDLEKRGYRTKWIRKDITETLRSVFRAFSQFNIDLCDYLKVDSDYEKKYGNYDEFKVTMIHENKERFGQQNKNQDEKVPAKFYALYHLLLVELGLKRDFDRDDNDNYSRIQIEEYARNEYPNISCQSFYRTYIEILSKSKLDIALHMKKGYKEKVITISNNNAKVIQLLEKYPN